MAGLIYGIGINDAKYLTQKFDNSKGNRVLLWVCPYYSKWKSMLQRCYSSRYIKLQPTYYGCTVCEEWLVFSNFKSWMEKQDYEGKHLDKDILFNGNKIYSPETCVFITRQLNNFLTDRKNHRGAYPIGVLKPKWGKFQANCNNGAGKNVYLGAYDTPEEAHAVWREYKHKLACKIADEQTDERVAEALRNRYKKENV